MSSQHTPRQSKVCPVCHSTQSVELLHLDRLPVICNNLAPDRHSALAVKQGEFRLTFCEKCGHSYNSAFDPNLMDYDANYETSLHYSKRFRQFASNLAKRLVETYDVREKTIVELGCGQGEFLSEVCRLGNNNGFGFDQSFDPTKSSLAENVSVLAENYGPKFSHLKADLFCCRHVLEHVADLRSFVSQLKRTMPQEHDTILYFEVPNGLYTMRDLGIWDLIYEHCSYFWSGSLELLFDRCGFEVYRVEPTYDGQFLSIDLKHPASASTFQNDPTPLESSSYDIAGFASAFADNFVEKIDFWKRYRAELAKNGKKAVIWGAGSKGVTFLNLTNPQHPDEFLNYAVDVSPRKHGKYIPGTGQEIVSPDHLKTIDPDVVFLMNPTYEQEVRSDLAALQIDAELKVA